MLKSGHFALVLAFVAVGSAAPAAKPQAISLTEGNFFVGQEPYPMYVEYRIPASLTHKTPIIFLHGGAGTGAGFISTPDGREGWALYFVRQGWKTYVVDWPGHGRSTRPEEFPTMSLQRVVDANVELLKKVGRAVVLTYSMSGPVGWKLAETVPDRVAAIVAATAAPPPNIPWPAIPEIRRSFTSSDDVGGRYFPESKPVWPVGALRAGMMPESPRAFNETWDKDGKGRFLVVDPKKFAIVPKLVIVGDQDERHPRAVDEATARFMGANFICLGDVGMPGHGHGMMIEKDNQKIAQLIIDWLVKKGL